MHNASLQETSPGDLVQTALYQALDMMNARQVREFAVPPSTLMGPGRSVVAVNLWWIAALNAFF